MPFATGKWKPYLASAAIACLGAFSAQPASASVCFTSGKVYVQQKVYDKAAYFLECARKGDPANIEALSLLAFARARQREFISAGAAFQLAIETATKKGDKKKVADLQRNRLAENAQLFNAGIAALNRAGSVSLDNERSSGDEGSPQGKIEKQYGPPREYARFTEAGRIHEFWCYPDSGVTFYFAPSSDEATRLEYKPYEGLGDLQHAVTDTTVFPLYAGGSYVAEAAYDFQLASYVDPMSLDTYQNLAYVLSLLGRTDDAIRAAQRGLTIKPDDERLHQNLRAAAMSRGNRLYNAKKYPKAIEILDRAGGLYPKNKEIWSLAGQTKYQAKDAKGAEAALRHALELDPQDFTNHQFLFLALNQLSRKEESVAEYTIYKALSEGTKKTEVKVWVDSADNRLGASNQLKTVVKTESYPEEVYTYNEGDKRFETWFYWSKGKSFTFMDGQIFSKGAFPPKK